MKQLGYYAKDKDGNLFRFEWSSEDEFSIALKGGAMQTQDPKDYEILEIGHFEAPTMDAEAQEVTQEVQRNAYYELRDKIWNGLREKGLFTEDSDDEFTIFDTVLGEKLNVNWE